MFSVLQYFAAWLRNEGGPRWVPLVKHRFAREMASFISLGSMPKSFTASSMATKADSRNAAALCLGSLMPKPPSDKGSVAGHSSGIGAALDMRLRCDGAVSRPVRGLGQRIGQRRQSLARHERRPPLKHQSLGQRLANQDRATPTPTFSPDPPTQTGQTPPSANPLSTAVPPRLMPKTVGAAAKRRFPFTDLIFVATCLLQYTSCDVLVIFALPMRKHMNVSYPSHSRIRWLGPVASTRSCRGSRWSKMGAWLLTPHPAVHVLCMSRRSQRSWTPCSDVFAFRKHWRRPHRVEGDVSLPFAVKRTAM